MAHVEIKIMMIRQGPIPQGDAWKTPRGVPAPHQGSIFTTDLLRHAAPLSHATPHHPSPAIGPSPAASEHGVDSLPSPPPQCSQV